MDIGDVQLGHQLLDIRLVRLEWQTADGCSKCRPALNYYLVCKFPELNLDEIDYVCDSIKEFFNS